MAHGWDSYFNIHPPLSPDSGSLRRKSESEGGLSKHIENFTGHHDFAGAEASHEAHATTSNFNTNSYSNPNIENSSSDCVYQSYYTETPWQADGEQMEKEYLPECGNGDISDFATDGLSTSGSFPSTFATDLQEIKQDCGIVATSFLEDYSDVSSCSDADVTETRPSCKFMANTSVQKLKTGVTTKHSLPEWLFSQSGNAVFPTESLCPNMSETNIILPTSSTVETKENIAKCAQEEMESPEKSVKSSPEHDQSSATSNVMLTISTETVKNGNNSDGCEYQKPKKEMERVLTPENYSDMTISGYKNLSDGIEDYPGGIQEEQITAITQSILTKFRKEQDYVDEKALRNEIEESLSPKDQGYGNVNSVDCQKRNATDDEPAKTEILQREALESFDQQKFLNPNFMGDQDQKIEIECEETELNTTQSTGLLGIRVSKDRIHKLTNFTSPLKSSHDVDSSLQLPKQQFYKSIAGHLSDYSDKDEQSVSSHAKSCLQSVSFNAGILPCLKKDWTSTGEKTVTFSTPDCNGVTSDNLFTDTSDMKGQSAIDLPEFILQADSSSTDIKPDLEKELTEPSRRTNATSSTVQECIGPAVTSGKNEPSVSSHAKYHLQPTSSSTDINSCLEKEMISLLEKETTTSFTAPDCSGSGEFGLQTQRPSTNINPCLEKDCTRTKQKTTTLSLDPDCNGPGATSDKNKLDVKTGSIGINPSLKEELTYQAGRVNAPSSEYSSFALTSDDNNGSVSSYSESCLQLNTSNRDINPCLEKDTSSRETSFSTENSTNLLHQSSVALEPQTLELDVSENARESFEILETTVEDGSMLGMLYGEPLSREESSCDTNESKPDTSEYKEMPEAKYDGSTMENSKGQALQRNPSGQKRKDLHPVVILKTLESIDGVNNSYHCAGCKHTTNSIDNLIEHHHFCHSVPNFQFCKTCNLYLITNEEAEKHLCGVTEESPKLSSASSPQKKTCRGKHKCNRCGLLFSKIVQFIRHMRIHTGKTPFKCNKCGLYFAQAGTLQRHLRIPGRCKQTNHHVITSNVVSNKVKSMLPPEDLIQYRANLPECNVKLVDISKTNLCSLCGKYFLTAEKTEKHVYNIHKKSMAVSTNQFSTKVSGENTPKEEDGTRGKYKCPLCPRLFKYSYNRARHLRDCVRDSVYGGKEKVGGKYRCPLCSTTFTLSSNRYRHIKAFCLRQCLSRLAKEKAKSDQKAEEKKSNELEQKIPPKENEEIKMPKANEQKKTTDAGTLPRYKCSLCPAAFCHASGKYKHMKKHELFKLTGKMFRYRISVFSTMSKPAILTSTKNEKIKDNLNSTETNSLTLSCHFCGKFFSTSQSLKKHERNHRGERPYRCLECGKGFKKRAHLFGHKIVHQRRIQCTVCRKILPTIGELIQHRSSHLKRGMLQCPDCDLQFQYPAHLLRHLDAHRNRENKAPQLEESTQLKPQQPVKSVKEESGPKQVQCSLCKEIFNDAQILRKHCLTHISGSSSNQCPFCKHNFNNRRYLLRHMIKHTGDKPYSCENCGKQFYRHLYLKLHNESCFPAQVGHPVTVESYTKTKRPYHCSYCPRTFCKKNRLKNHHHGHKANTLLLCSRCGQYFGFRKLNQHQKNCGETEDPLADSPNIKSTSQINQNIHNISLQTNTSKVLQLKCPHCTQRFKYRSLLLRHLVSHTGLQPYACMHCGHRYGSQTMCLQHEAFCDGVYKEGLSKVKSNAAAKLSSMPIIEEATPKPQAEGENEYKCKFCTKTFIKSRNLRHHILTHNEVKPYRCKACDSCFSRYDHLKVHQTRCKGKKQRLEVCIPKISLDDVGKGWQIKFGNEPAKKQESFECKVCLRSFPTQSRLSRHVTMFHVTKLFKCARCGSSFAHEKSLKKHRKMNRCRRISNEANPLQKGPDPLTENLTNPLQGVKSRILQRIKPCFNKKYKYVCSYCPRAFGNSWQLGVHTRLHTGEKPFACDYCGQSFIRKDYLQRHFAKCTKKQLNQVLCDRCGGFFSKMKLENHKKNCTVVPSISESKSCQDEQSVSQSPPKGFSCAYCNSRFLLFSQLQEHFLNAHKLETMVPLASTAPLQHHLSNMPNIKEEPLDESYDKLHNEDANLTCKLDTDVNSEVTKQFFCPECCISFASKSGLSAHLRGHARKYPFKCKTCKKGFWNKSLLRNHYRKCRFGPTSERNSTQNLEIPLKAEIDFALNDPVLVFKEGSKTTGTAVLQTNVPCKDDSMDRSSQKSKEVQSSSSKEKAVQYQCSECDKSFTDGLLLISHLEDHGREEQEKKRNTCSKCGRVCDSQSSLDKHMKMHGIDKKYPCPDCSKMVYTSSDLEIHRTCHDTNRPFACKLCNQRFWTRPSLCNHYGEDHRDDAFFCLFCNKAYSVKKSLTRHYRKWHQKEQKDLGGIVQGRSNIEEQSIGQVSTTGESDEDENNGSGESDSDSAPYFPCHVCGKTFTTSESLEDHQRCHLGEKPHECEECGKCFFQASQLQQHQRMHKSEFQCQACGRGFVSLFALRKHKHTHGKSRPYRCSKCHLSFTGPSQLAEHMSTHREENFPCDICNHVFLSKSSRAEHRKSHSKSGDQHPHSILKEEHEKSSPLKNASILTKELKYRCGVCSERFRDPEELSEHGCMAAKERPYSCSDCSKHFLHASHLKKHKATHQPSWSSSEYPCNKCNKCFSSSQHFLSHLKTHIDTAASFKLNLEERDEGPSHNFICPVCHQFFASAAELSCHFPTHPDGTFERKICKKSVPSGSKVYKLERHHLTLATEFECTECGQNFLESDAFHQHICSHQQHTIMENKYKDPSAKVSSSSYSQAGDDEEVDVTGEDLYNCPHCSRQFTSKSSLLEHQNKQHFNEKPFKCELCGKTFALRRYLREHERRHQIKLTSQNTSQSPEKKFRCTQCHTKFNTTQDLSVHMRLHAEKEVGEFRCDMCYKSFSQWHLLKLHQESHVGEVVYECTECDKAFAFPHLLEEHQRTHAGSSH
ncbi:Zinc finger protein 208 Zinc finger protein 91-like [Channa argus]|uniref:Zinc finger protein 208 Zinc finger protein 91-like n=1 Tax=Channa argus TaxID=215402 RepID=A0A6G1PP56_CHAAH|nr:Zinc finger protein 208 Zinc finger protein 91-like [Channa argus]